MSNIKTFTRGVLQENPLFVLVLGGCPALATTTSAINGAGMGIATALVLIFSNMVISLMAGIVPDKVRIPVYIIVIASFVTVIDLLMQAYTPTLYKALGIFIPLIVVNCLLLGRAEGFANKNGVVASAFDGLGMGLGFTGALIIMGAIREIIGSGAVMGHKIIAGDGILIFVLAPGAFFVLAYLIAVFTKIIKK